MLTPWDKLEQHENESMIDFVCRKVRTMTRWHADNEKSMIALGDECRSMSLSGIDAGIINAHYQSKLAALYAA